MYNAAAGNSSNNTTHTEGGWYCFVGQPPISAVSDNAAKPKRKRKRAYTRARVRVTRSRLAEAAGVVP